jgi:hypothetical protein
MLPCILVLFFAALAAIASSTDSNYNTFPVNESSVEKRMLIVPE